MMRVVFDDKPSALTDARLEELYRGNDIISINAAAAGSRPAQAKPA
jgi:hypothetical protein